jgi:hypothetical protein
MLAAMTRDGRSPNELEDIYRWRGLRLLDVMSARKVIAVPKARPIPDAKNRPTTPIPGMKKKNTRMRPALTEKQGAAAPAGKRPRR